MTKKTKIAICSTVLAVIFTAALILGLFFGLMPKSFNDKINALLKDSRFANENVIGFAIADKNDTVFVTNNNEPNVVFDTEFLKKTDATFAVDFMVINKNFELENVLFKNKFNSKEIGNGEIQKFGVINQYCVMNDFLYVGITENRKYNDNIRYSGAQGIHHYKDSKANEPYFTIDDSNTVIAVDLVSKNIYSIYDACMNAGILTEWNNYSVQIDLKSGLLRTNTSMRSDLIEDFRHEVYYINYHDDTVELNLVGKQCNGDYFQDKHKNIYFVEDEERPDNIENIYDFTYVNIFERDNFDLYTYFCSSDFQIYRALNSSLHQKDGKEYYYQVESLQADKRWRLETSSSRKILSRFNQHSQLWHPENKMLIDGRIVLLAVDPPAVSTPCYNINGRVLSHVKNTKNEAIIDLGDAGQFNADFKYIDFTKGLENYEKIAYFTANEDWKHSFKYNLNENSFGFSLRVYDKPMGLLRYSTETYYLCGKNTETKQIELKPSKNYNSFEILSSYIM